MKATQIVPDCHNEARFMTSLSLLCPAVLLYQTLLHYNIVVRVLWNLYLVSFTGKSNMMDAVCFVMGEKAANLRVRKLQVSPCNCNCKFILPHFRIDS